MGFYLTGRGTVNETYYAAQKAVRAMGVNSIDNAARICHAPSSDRAQGHAGRGGNDVFLRDWIGTDLLVFIGSIPPTTSR